MGVEREGIGDERVDVSWNELLDTPATIIRLWEN